jgi:hypothetical protein
MRKFIVYFLLIWCNSISVNALTNRPTDSAAYVDTLKGIVCSSNNKDLSGIDRVYKSIRIYAEIENGYTYDSLKIQAIENEAASEFQKVSYEVDINFTTLILTHKLNGSHSVRKLIKEGNKLRVSGCSSCQDSFYEIVEKTDKKLLLRVKNQDENANYNFLIVFELETKNL